MKFFETGKLELYNLKQDIGETQDLSQTELEKTKELQAMLTAWLTKVNASRPAPNEAYVAGAEKIEFEGIDRGEDGK